MITDFSKSTPPSLDKRWRIVDATMRRLGNQSRGLIDIIATGHNNLAMNRGILQVAKHFVRGERLTSGMVNRVEALIRAYDPCLSCSTHAWGEMPLIVQLLSPLGKVLDEVRRPA